jgi:hypothetical protein
MTDEDAAELRKMAAACANRCPTSSSSPPWTLLSTGNLEHRRQRRLEKLLNSVVGPFPLMAGAVLVSPMYKRNWPAISWQQVILERKRDACGHQPLVDAICNRNVPAALRAIDDHLTINYQSSPEEFGRKVAEHMRKYWN